MDVALSRNGKRVMRVFFALVVAFLYAPIVILLIFSFDNSQLPSFPLSGFTLRWYHQFLTNSDLQSALATSAKIAALSSLGAVALGILASIALVRRAFRGKSPVSALLLSPLVIPYVVFGISLLLLFHAVGISLSFLTIVIGHIVITLPYTILVLMPRLQQVDVSLEEAAQDLGAGRLQTFRLVTFPLILPAVVSAFLVAFTTSFDEYAVASFVAGSTQTFPIYLYSAVRFPYNLPQVIAVAVVVITISLLVVVAAEVWRRRTEARLEAVSSLWIADERVAGGVGVHETSLPTAETVDLGGRCALPGFTDSHVHFPTWALARHDVRLHDCASLAEALDHVRAAPSTGSWLRGQGWRDADWRDGPPTRHALDEVEPARPAMLISKDYHALWLNSVALALADGDLEVEGGVVVRDERGEPTGVLYERAAWQFKERLCTTRTAGSARSASGSGWSSRAASLSACGSRRRPTGSPTSASSASAAASVRRCCGSAI